MAATTSSTTAISAATSTSTATPAAAAAATPVAVAQPEKKDAKKSYTTLYRVLGVLALVAVLFLLWWYFHKRSAVKVSPVTTGASAFQDWLM